MDVSAIILAGGKSSRMGQDKGLMDLDGKPMIQHVIDAVKPITNDIVIVSNQEGYDQFGYTVVEDEIKDCGPLAGIVTGLKNVQSEQAIVLSCDVPHITEELLALLLDSPDDIILLRSEGKAEPLIARYGVHCARIFETAILDGTRKVTDAFEYIEVTYVDIPADYLKFVKNVNTQQDLE